MRIASHFVLCILILAGLIAAPTNLSAQACYTPPANMVGWWTGDGNAKDLAGPNNGKLINGATFAAGYVGKAFALNGTQYVDIKKATPIYVSAGDFTVDTWVSFSAISGADQSIVDKMANGGVNIDGWRLLLQANDLFWFCLGNGANGCNFGAPTTVMSTTTATAGNWYFVAATKTSSTISIYINGNLENTTGLGPFTDSNSSDLFFGHSNGYSANLSGLVDEVELFNRALSADEIMAIYNAGHTGKCKVVVAATPKSLTFASQPVGTTSPPQAVTVKNKTPNGAILNITNIATTGDFGQTNNCPASLNPGAKCTIEVTFTPTQTGTRTGKLTITDNTPNGLPQTVSLTGTGQ